MAQHIRCPKCYGRLAIADDANVDFDLEMHRLSGHCRAAEKPKERAPRKPSAHAFNKLDDWLGGEY